jgi:oleate hydratase
LIGSGIGNLASAAYLIKDGNFSGENITINEEESLPGGALDAAGVPEDGYIMRGERMMEPNYVCWYDLLSFIPSVDDPTSRSHRTRLSSAGTTRGTTRRAWSPTARP